MNERSRKMMGLSRRLMAWLLCCVFLVAASPVSATTLEDSTPAAETTVTEQLTEATTAEPVTTSVTEPMTTIQSTTTENVTADTSSSEPGTTAEAGTPEAATANGEISTTAEGTSEGTTEVTTATEGTTVTESTTVTEGTTVTDTTEDTSKDESVSETEKSAAEALYERIMACTTYEAVEGILSALTEEERSLMDEFTDEQNAALAAKMEELGAYDVNTTVDRGAITIQQGGNYSQSVSDMSGFTGFSCEPNASGITVEATTAWLLWNSGYKINVGDTVEAGTYTLTVKYSVYSSPYDFDFWSKEERTDTITLTVTKKGNDASMVFALKTPLSDPDSNNPSEWYPANSGADLGDATVNMTGATWVNDKNVFNPGKYIVSMPNGMTKQADGSYLLSKTSYSTAWKTIFDAFKESVQKDYPGITISEDNAAIYLVPYKISKNNSGTKHDYHIDCKVSIKVEGVYAAIFWVDMLDGTRKQADAKYYQTGASVVKTDKAPTGTSGSYPETYTGDDGNVYEFDGWYNEAGEKVSDWTNGYSPNEAELADGTVNFYAKYVLKPGTLTVKKTLSGNMYNKDATFSFTVSYNNNGKSEEETFDLGMNEEKKITIPVGATVTVKENDSQGYKYSLTSVGGTTYTELGDGSKGITFTMPSNDVSVVINNEKKKNVVPDTGVILDTLPYILILAVVIIGGVLLIGRRRSRNDA